MLDLFADLVRISKEQLNKYPVPVSYSDCNRDVDIVHRWFNVRSRLISTRKRQVIYSSALNKDIFKKFHSEISFIEKNILNSGDLNIFLSKSIFRPDFNDYLLSDWNIYHFHLSTSANQRNNYFVSRSDNLLFCLIDDISVYGIDVRKHSENYVFARNHLLSIIHSNWPEKLESFRVKNILDVSFSPSLPEQIHQLRKSGLTQMYQVNSDTYLPMGGGITMGGTSAKVGIQLTDILDQIQYTQDDCNKYESKLKKLFSQHGQDLNLELVFNDERFYVCDPSSNIGFPLGMFPDF